MLIFVDYHKEKMNYYKLVSRTMERFTRTDNNQVYNQK